MGIHSSRLAFVVGAKLNSSAHLASGPYTKDLALGKLENAPVDIEGRKQARKLGRDISSLGRQPSSRVRSTLPWATCTSWGESGGGFTKGRWGGTFWRRRLAPDTVGRWMARGPGRGACNGGGHDEARGCTLPGRWLQGPTSFAETFGTTAPFGKTSPSGVPRQASLLVFPPVLALQEDCVGRHGGQQQQL